LTFLLKEQGRGRTCGYALNIAAVAKETFFLWGFKTCKYLQKWNREITRIYAMLV